MLTGARGVSRMTDRGRTRNAWRRRLYLPAYSTVEAARFAQTKPRTVAYWHYGTGTRVGPALGGKKRYAPLSYLQLVEVAFVASFRQHGVPLQRIRKAREYVAKVFGAEFPFAEYRFKTEGFHVLMDAASVDPDFSELIAADEAGQMAWEDVLLERFEQFDYEEDLAVRWHLRGRDVPILIDPRISFGAPILERTGIPTWVLKGRFEAGETLEEIEDDFEVPQRDIVYALEFERVKVAA
jgi:uncharacterized protein (DUF433 family)